MIAEARKSAAVRSLGKGEVHSSILCGSTTNIRSNPPVSAHLRYTQARHKPPEHDMNDSALPGKVVGTLFPLDSRRALMLEARSTLGSNRRVLMHLCVKQDWKCAYCGEEMSFDGPRGLTPAVEHVIPLIRAGRSEPDNLVAACCTCNSKKGDLTAIEYRARLAMVRADRDGSFLERMAAKAAFYEARALCLAEEAKRYAAEAEMLRKAIHP